MGSQLIDAAEIASSNISELKEKIIQTSKLLKIFKSNEKDLLHSKTKLESTASESEHIRRQLNHARQEWDQVCQESESLKERITELENLNQRLSESQSSIEKELLQKAHQVESLKVFNAQLVEDIRQRTASQPESQELKSANKALLKEKETLAANILKAEQACTILKNRNNEIEAKLKEFSSQEKKLEAMKTQLENAKDKAKLAEMERDSANRKAIELGQKLTQAENKLQQSRDIECYKGRYNDAVKVTRMYEAKEKEKSTFVASLKQENAKNLVEISFIREEQMKFDKKIDSLIEKIGENSSNHFEAPKKPLKIIEVEMEKAALEENGRPQDASLVDTLSHEKTKDSSWIANQKKKILDALRENNDLQDFIEDSSYVAEFDDAPILACPLSPMVLPTTIKCCEKSQNSAVKPTKRGRKPKLKSEELKSTQKEALGSNRPAKKRRVYDESPEPETPTEVTIIEVENFPTPETDEAYQTFVNNCIERMGSTDCYSFPNKSTTEKIVDDSLDIILGKISEYLKGIKTHSFIPNDSAPEKRFVIDNETVTVSSSLPLRESKIVLFMWWLREKKLTAEVLGWMESQIIDSNTEAKLTFGSRLMRIYMTFQRNKNEQEKAWLLIHDLVIKQVESDNILVLLENAAKTWPKLLEQGPRVSVLQSIVAGVCDYTLELPRLAPLVDRLYATFINACGWPPRSQAPFLDKLLDEITTDQLAQEIAIAWNT